MVWNTVVRSSALKSSGGTSSSMGAGSPSPIHTNTLPFSVRVGKVRACKRPTILESGPSVMNSTHSPGPVKAAPWYAQLRYPRHTHFPREGGTLNCAPSADAVAGNGRPLSWAPSAHAVAGGDTHRDAGSSPRGPAP